MSTSPGYETAAAIGAAAIAGALLLAGPAAAIAFVVAILGLAAYVWFGYRQASLVLGSTALFLVAFNAVRPVGGATVSDVFFVLAMALICAWALAAGHPLANLPSWLWASAAIFVIAAGLVAIFPAAPSQAALFFPGGAFNHQPGEEVTSYSNFEALLRLELALLLVPFVLMQIGNSWRRIRQLSDAWLAGTALAGAVGVAAYLGLVHASSLIGGDVAAGDSRVRGLSTHPNVFGVTAAMVLPVAAVFYPAAQGRRKLYYLAVLAVLGLAILTSGSRAAIFGGLFGLALLALTDPASRVALRRLALAGAILIVVAGIATFKDLPGIDRLSGRGAAAQSDVAREAIYGHVIHEIEQRPIVGHGFEYLKGSHNIYLQVLHSGGLIALLGLLTLVVGVIVTGLKVASRSQQPIVRALLASSLVWLAVDGMFEPAIFDRYLYVPIGLLLACWSVSRLSDESQPEQDTSHGPDLAPDMQVASRVRNE